MVGGENLFANFEFSRAPGEVVVHGATSFVTGEVSVT